MDWFVKMSKKTIWIVVCLFALYSLNFGQNDKQLKVVTVGVLNDKAKILSMPKASPVQPRIAGMWVVQVKVDLQKGEVVWAKVVSGHVLLRLSAEKAAKQAKFEPMLTEFDTIYAMGVLIYKLEEFNGKTIENKRPKSMLSIVNLRDSIINGKAINLEKPVYPEDAKNSCANGKVEVLTLLNNWKGEVVAAKAISGNELLFEVSEKAVMKSNFAPSNISTNNDFYILGKVVYNFDSLSKCINVGVVNKNALSLPKPQIANLSHFRINEEQIVAVQVVIDESGNVITTEAIFGHALLRQASEFAARQAKFAPTLIEPGPLKVKALIIYRFKPDRTIETDIEKDDAVLGKLTNFVEPIPPFCNCRFASNPKVLVQVEVDEQGHITKATAISGHQLLKIVCEKAALATKFLPINFKTQLILSYNFTEISKWSVKYSSFEVNNVKIFK